jgi:hypothetical protein
MHRPTGRLQPVTLSPGVAASHSGYYGLMISAIFGVIMMILGLVLDIITLPFRILFALLGGAEFEFRRFSRR